MLPLPTPTNVEDDERAYSQLSTADMPFENPVRTPPDPIRLWLPTVTFGLLEVARSAWQLYPIAMATSASVLLTQLGLLFHQIPTTMTILLVISTVFVLGASYLYMGVVHRAWYRTLLLDRLAKRFQNAPGRVSARNAFLGTTIEPRRGGNGHDHGAAARTRRAAEDAVADYARRTHSRLFSYSLSNRDRERGVPGQRSYYWIEDLATPPANDKPAGPTSRFPGGTVSYVTDAIEYYASPTDLLAEAAHHSKGGAIMVYCCCPTKAGGSADSGEHAETYFTADGLFNMRIGTNLSFKHALLDWHGHSELVLIHRLPWWLGGFARSATAYKVFRREVGSERMLVLLEPIAHFGPIGAWYIQELPITHLKPWNPVYRGSDGVDYVAFERHGGATGAKPYITIGLAGRAVSATIPLSTATALEAIVGNDHTLKFFTAQTVISTRGTDDPIVSKPDAHLIAAYYRAGCSAHKMPKVGSASPPQMYKASPIVVGNDEDPMVGKDRGQFAFPSPDQRGTAPAVCDSNEASAINGRVASIATAPLAISEVTAHNITLFAGAIALCAPPGSVTPVGEEDVFMRQDRPTQRRNLYAAGVNLDRDKHLIDAFVKAECYQNSQAPHDEAIVKDPRVISARPTLQLTGQMWFTSFSKSSWRPSTSTCSV